MAKPKGSARKATAKKPAARGRGRAAKATSKSA